MDRQSPIDVPVPDLEPRPFITAHFVLYVEGVYAASFSECTGLTGEVGTEEYAEGGENRFTHRFPSRISHPVLSLKRGLTMNPALWWWFAELAETGRVGPRNGQILLLASTSVGPAPSPLPAPLVPVKAWSFKRGYPSRIAGPDLIAGAPTVAFESVDITHHGLDLVRTPAQVA